jgi:3-hydroxyacyl-CoA dehydrogenase
MKNIKNVAVLGAGVMGSALACHAANAGLQVLLLDIVDPKLADKANTTHAERNAWTDTALKACIKSKPAPLFSNKLASHIETGNLTDDLHRIAECDWILEVIIERLDIKQQLYERIEAHRKPGTIVTSNTSGIPIHMLTKGRSDDFRQHFFGTHFFNPPRYLQLLELIPGPDTKAELITMFAAFGGNILGKTIVYCKDTPAFIGNRIGVYAMAYIYSEAIKSGLPISTIDRLTGPAIGRPKTGTFRLGDLVGLDVAAKVIEGIKANCPDDEMIQELEMPAYFDFLLENKYLGNKTGQGFYKKTAEKDEKGRAVIQELNLSTMEYGVPERVNLDSLSTSKQIDDPARRIKSIFKSEDAGGALIRKSLLALFAYSSKRIPEISDDILQIDKALKTGFGWSFGAFEYWDIIGLDRVQEAATAEGFTLAPWVSEARAAGMSAFYQWKSDGRYYWDIPSKTYQRIPEHPAIIHLRRSEEKPLVYQNDEVHLHDIGDGVLCLEFKSKMNAIGEGILTGVQASIDLAERDGWKGLVIGNQADNFTVGANLMMIGMMAFQQQYDMLNMAVKQFQDTTMRCRYSAIPVVAATQGFVFGGGCELAMHCDSIAAAAESYVGLVEVGVGLLPGGGGTKEFALRASDSFVEGGVEIPTLIDKFKTIATAHVATSALEAMEHGLLLPGRDHIVMHKNRNIGVAKKLVLSMADAYQEPLRRKDITVLGRTGLGALYTAANELYRAGYASEHDIKIAKKVAFVLCGGDLSEKQQVSEDYLLEIEREAFLSLCAEPKTMERIQHMLDKGKALRN